MEERKKIVIAEDHTILREGLRVMLSSTANLEVIGEAGDGLEAIAKVSKLKPDLLLLDIGMPKMDGMSVIREIKKLSPETKILALTVHQAEQYVLETFRLGVDGYCLKEASRVELMTAINSVLSGKTYLSPGVSEKVMEGYLEGRKSLKDQSSWDQVTPREREILKLVGEGYKNKEIANFLYISPKTVEKHRANIMRKLNIRTATALAAYAVEKGLVNNKE